MKRTNLQPDEPADWPAKISWAALVIAAALVVGRATILETLRDEISGDAQAPRGPGAAVSILLDLALWLPALLVLLRRCIDRNFRLRANLSPLIFLALAIWAAASTAWASDKFAAAVHASHLVAAGALMWAMSQLARSWTHARIIAGVCFGLLLISIAHGAMYRFIDLPDDIKYWQDHKAEQLAQRGWDADSFEAIQFEKRINAGEMFGFNASPNTFAAELVLLACVCAGVAIQRFALRDEPGWGASIVVILPAAAWVMVYTRCRTALVTPILAALMIALAPRLERRRRLSYLSTVACVIATAIFLIARGMQSGTLFHPSLTFRWHYWIGAARLFMLHPFLGVGWANFGANYLAVRLPVASEEIKDPHNIFVRAFVELGLIGGAIMIAWIARAGWEIAEKPAAPMPAERAHPAKIIGGIALLGIVINILASIDFSVAGTDGAWYAALELFKRFLFLGLLVLGLCVTTIQSSHRVMFDDRPAPWISRAMLAGLAVFLVHNLIDFSIFEIGPMMIFAMLAGTVLGLREPKTVQHETPRWMSAAVFSTAILAWFAMLLGVAMPVAWAENDAHRAQELRDKNDLMGASSAMLQAFHELWIPNADYAYRAAFDLAPLTRDPSPIVAILNEAAKADPSNSKIFRLRAQAKLRLSGKDSFDDYQRVLELNPHDVRTRIEYGTALLQFNDPQSAVREYKTALANDDALETGDPRRMNLSQRKILEEKVRSLGG